MLISKIIAVKKSQLIVSGSYKVTSNHSGSTLDNKDGSTQSGSMVRQWEDNNAPAQRWFLETAGNGLLRIKNQAGGLYIDTENQSTNTHVPLV